MRCDCKEGSLSPHRFPQWEYQWGKLFHRTKCPIEWFKPDLDHERLNNPGGILNAIHRKIIEWRKIVKLYEDYWVQRKNEFEKETT
jgi:hypothetical protein